MLSPEPSASPRSKIKRYWSQITITNILIMKKFEIFQEYRNEIWRHKVSRCFGKMMLTDLLDIGLPQTFNLWKIQSL